MYHIYTPAPAHLPCNPNSHATPMQMFIWNAHLTRELRASLGGEGWLVALVHGSWDQRRLSGEQKMSMQFYLLMRYRMCCVQSSAANVAIVGNASCLLRALWIGCAGGRGR